MGGGWGESRFRRVYSFSSFCPMLKRNRVKKTFRFVDVCSGGFGDFFRPRTLHHRHCTIHTKKEFTRLNGYSPLMPDKNGFSSVIICRRLPNESIRWFTKVIRKHYLSSSFTGCMFAFFIPFTWTLSTKNLLHYLISGKQISGLKSFLFRTMSV